MRIVYILSLILASLSNGILILLLRRRTPNSAIISTFIVLLTLINIWAIPQIIVELFVFTEDLYFAIDKISDLGYVLIPAAFSLFALSYIHNIRKATSFWFILSVYVLTIVFLYLCWNTNLIEMHSHGAIQSVNWGHRIKVGMFFPLMVLWFETVVISSMIAIINHYRKTLDPLHRKQSQLLIIAILIPLIFGTITNGLFPALHLVVLPIAVPLTSIMALVIAYAILKYGLFEMSSVTILSSLGSGIITINTERKVMQINDIAQKMLGVKGQDIVGQHFDAVVRLRKQPRIDDATNKELLFDAVLTSGQQVTSRNFLMSDNRKKSFAVEYTLAPIFAQKQIAGATIIFRDISREKEIEKSKNEFISIASHELKTPLTAIIAFSQLFERLLLKENNQKHMYYIRSMNEQLLKMKNLVEDLLNVSRLETGVFVLKKKPCDLNDLVAMIIKDFQSNAATHTITKRGIIKAPVDIDSDKIRQVITNLLSNAIKYSPQADEVILTLAEQGKDLVVSVQDFGIGIPKKDAHKIFQRFYRTSISQHSTISGFGLGLYISNAIVRSHKGKMWVNSLEGKGSTFSFSLPKK